MRCHGEALFGKLCRANFSLSVDQHIEDAIAHFADEVLMALHQRIEVLGASEHQYLQLF